MTALALVSGRIFRAPERKVSKAGKSYVAATVREGEADAAVWWKVLCFSEACGDELMRLGDGDGVAVSGSFKVDTYDGKNGELRLSHTIFADRVISARKQKREKEKPERADIPPTSTAPSPAGAPLDDEIPF